MRRARVRTPQLRAAYPVRSSRLPLYPGRVRIGHLKLLIDVKDFVRSGRNACPLERPSVTAIRERHNIFDLTARTQRNRTSQKWRFDVAIPQLLGRMTRLVCMVPSADSLSRGFHAAADVAIATTAAFIVVGVCYPINLAAAAVKIPVRLVRRSYNNLVRFSPNYRVADLKRDLR